MCVCVYVYMWVTHSATPWTVAHQAPLSKGFSRQEYWSGLPLPPPRESSWPRDQTHISCIADGFFIVWATKEAPSVFRYYKNSLVFWGKTEVHWPPTLGLYLPVQGLTYTFLLSTPSGMSCTQAAFATYRWNYNI